MFYIKIIILKNMNIFIELSLILIITTGITTLVQSLKQPLIVGYLLSGIIVGPFFLNILQSSHEIELFSKIGITILLFIVGISLNPSSIKETGKTSLITGVGQVLFTSVIGFMIMKGLGYSNIASMYGSIALTFSSTIIILKLLSDRGDLGTLYGKISVGFLLVQDIIATLLLIIIPLVGAHSASKESIGLKFFVLFVSGVASSIGLYLIAKYILPRFSNYFARSQEILLLFSVSWGLVLSTFFYKIGFSIEIGALIAGVTLSASKYSYEISSRMRPLRDFFIVLFFVLLGSQLIVSNIASLLLPAIILSLFVLIGNPFIVFILMNILGYKNKTSFMAGLTVAQISEFSLILITLGFSLGHLNQQVVTLITLVGIITIAGSSYFIIFADKIYDKLKHILKYISLHKKEIIEENNKNDLYEIIIFGFGRVGLEFVEEATNKNLRYIAVDYDPKISNSKQAKNINYRFGDVEDIEFLEDINTSKANIVISTIPDVQTNMFLARYYRSRNPTGVLLIMSHSVMDAKKLYEEGATYVILPHYLGAYHATQMISNCKENPEVFEKAREIQKKQIIKHS